MELLMPAGSLQSLKAAVDNGADAVYFGMGKYNARASAKEFDAVEGIEYCNAFGAKPYITLNTLTLDREMESVLNEAKQMHTAGAAAFIVQDIGLVKNLQQFTDINIHASTQMCIHTLDGVKKCQEMGMSRVVLSRECCLKDIKEIASKTAVELEVFVHGAMCASVSGQCLISSFIGARSGNRGQCAQPCRTKYDILQKQGYALSLKDMCMIEHIDDLLQSGVSSIKIEGRMKRPEYVAITAQAYRAAIDGKCDSEYILKQLLQIFNRGGFSSGYYYNANQLIYNKKPNHCGVLAAKPDKEGSRLIIDVLKGDTLAYRDINADEDAEITVKEDAKAGEIVYSIPKELYRTVSVLQLENALLAKKRVKISAHLKAQIGQESLLEFFSANKNVVVRGEIASKAQNAPLDCQKARQAIAKLNDTAYELENFTADIDQGVYLSASGLNALRREAVLQIANSYKRNPIKVQIPTIKNEAKTLNNELIVQCQTVEQAQVASQIKGVSCIYATAQDYDEIEKFKIFASNCKLPVYIVFPPFIEQGEIKNAIAKAGGFSGAVAGNIGQISPLLKLYKDVRCDYTQNVTNAFSANILQNLGASSVTLSPELNLAQINDITKNANCEVIMYGNLPMMHLCACPIKNVAGCNNCKKEGTEIVGIKGHKFILLPTKWGKCCTKLLNCDPLDARRAKDAVLINASKRLCFYTQTPNKVTEIINGFINAINGIECTPELKSTAGHFNKGVQSSTK